MTDDRHDAEAATTRKGRRGPIVEGPEAREAARPARSAKSAGEPPAKTSQGAKTVAPTPARVKNPTPGP
jgi:hypothetical protein